MEIVFEQLPGLLVELRKRSGPLLRSQRFSPLGLVDVALTEERLTEKVRDAWALDIPPPPTAETILRLRSTE
jgi:predicted glycosyltransferase